MAKSKTQDLRNVLKDPPPRKPVLPDSHYLSTGVTTLNLAISGKPLGGIAKGNYVYFVGDSSSGKTWLAFQIFAEAARNPEFGNYELVYDNVENGALFDVQKLFGEKTYKRVRPPGGTRSQPKFSRTVEDYYFTLDSYLNRGPCIYVVDSMSALSSRADDKKYEEAKEKWEKDEVPEAGSYGMSKAKTNSQNSNRAAIMLADTGSILLVINQTRDKVGSAIPGQKTAGGGKALRFYAHVELWTSIKEVFKKGTWDIGAQIEIDVQKNRLSGWEGKIRVPFYKQSGFDDLGALVDFMVSDGHWKKDQSGRIEAPEFTGDKKLYREALVKKIEDDDAERELQILAASTWERLLEESKPDRKQRYT
jgi:RecA/RadA recombinase